MLLIDFIKDNDDWRDILADAPYHITIKDYAGKEDDLKDLTILKYDQIKSDFNNPIVRECRGIIINRETLGVVCHPFDKFGNYGESYVPDIDWDTATVVEKVDGSLIKLYWYKGKWRVATNGTVNAFECDLPKPTAEFKTFGELFMYLFGEVKTQFLDTDYVYLFELCSNWNRVVVPHEEPTLYLLSTRNRYDYTYPSQVTIKMTARGLMVGTPKTYPLKSLEDVVKASEELPWDDEGYVVVDARGNRVKIKSPSYVRVHHLSDNGNVSIKRLYELVRTGEAHELLTYYPEYQEYVDAVVYIRKRLFDMVRESIQRRWLPWQVDANVGRPFPGVEDAKVIRKQFAMCVNNHEHPILRPVAFRWFDDQFKSVGEYFNMIKDANIIKMIEEYVNGK